MIRTFQFNFRRKTCLFRIRWGFFFLCILLFCLCVALGIWQLHRYAYKKALLVTWQTRLSQAPNNFANIADTNDVQFASVKIQGHYLNALTILVQNRFYHDQLGFEVLTPVQMPHDKKWLWVDRGWIQKSEASSLLNIQTSKGDQEMCGHLKLLDEYQFILGKNILQPDSKPIVVQRVDIGEFQQKMHHEFYPFILRLNADQANGFVRDWTIVTVPPSRHMVYAVQWFAFALILLVGYFCFCCEEKKICA